MPSFTFNVPEFVNVAITEADIAEALRVNTSGGNVTAQQIANQRSQSSGGSRVKTYVIEGPPGSTKEQAEKIFQQQLALGQLKSLNIGETVNQQIAKVATALPKVDTSTIIKGTASLADTAKMQLGDFARQTQAKGSIAGLDIDQVTGMMAQTSKISGQAATTVSSKGLVGKYAISPQQLEEAGLLKPGTVQRFGTNPNQLVAMLQSPKVWTGKNGASSLDAVLGDSKIQDLAQQSLFAGTLDKLKASGQITGTESAAQLAGLATAGAKFGTDAAAQLAKGVVPPNLGAEAQKLLAAGQFAVDAVASKIPSAMKGVQSAAKAIGTVNRQALNTAMTSILPSGKIPVPSYENPAAIIGAATGTPVNANALQQIAQNAQGIAQQVTQQVQNTLG